MTRAECLAFERAVLALLGPGKPYVNPDGRLVWHEWLLPSTEGGDVHLTLWTDSKLPGRADRASMLACGWRGGSSPPGCFSRSGKVSFYPSSPDLAGRIRSLGLSPYINEVSP